MTDTHQAADEEPAQPAQVTEEPAQPAQVTEEPAQPAQVTEEPGKKSFWPSLSPDMRTLVVTVAGTVIANILTVMVVALAVLVTKLNNKIPKRLSWTEEWEVAGAAFAAGMVVLVITTILKRLLHKDVSLFLWIGGALVVWMFLILVVLGKALGVS
jgi:energy-converting hydrogenase Eha subunit A